MTSYFALSAVPQGVGTRGKGVCVWGESGLVFGPKRSRRKRGLGATHILRLSRSRAKQKREIEMLRQSTALLGRVQRASAARSFSAAAGDVKFEFSTPFQLHSALPSSAALLCLSLGLIAFACCRPGAGTGELCVHQPRGDAVVLPSHVHHASYGDYVRQRVQGMSAWMVQWPWRWAEALTDVGCCNSLGAYYPWFLPPVRWPRGRCHRC